MTTLLVASTGGHLKELHHLHRRLAGVTGPFRWVTFDTPQSRSLLSGEDVDFVPFVGGRDPINVARNFATARRILAENQIDVVVSTGSAVALPFFVLGRARGIPCHFVESAARIDGPSLTGKLISGVPGVNLYPQYRHWEGRKWAFRGSVFDAFEPCAGGGLSARVAPSRVVVTLGTYRGYPFTRLVRRLCEILPPGADVLWQTGDTAVEEFGIDGLYAIPEDELMSAMQTADVIIAHAGVGTALAAFEAGRCPILVPRRFAHGEHVDDHQAQIAVELRERKLAVVVDADELGPDHLHMAMSKGVGLTSAPESFAIGAQANA
jgi:UDP-N-acetylglucosamine--N-acetylmuramyl-(pentapeptide) pyrophosphoryl-undecaprenol N-acetylglucosamine transferase